MNYVISKKLKFCRGHL